MAHKTVAIDARTVQRAQQEIASCEACAPDEADIPFDYVLDCMTGCDPQYTDYVLKVPARCPQCKSAILTGTWHRFRDAQGVASIWIIPGTLVTPTDS